MNDEIYVCTCRMDGSDLVLCQHHQQIAAAAEQTSERADVRRINWLDAVQPFLRVLENHEAAAPPTEAWQRDAVKVEVSLGDLRRLRQLASISAISDEHREKEL